jgi:hypothetical protein
MFGILEYYLFNISHSEKNAMGKNLSVIVAVLIFLSACTHYKTGLNSSEPSLQPRILKGPTNEIQSIVYEAARKAFPDEINNISIGDNGKISILREWFWRGDTLITVFIEEKQTNEFIINAESKASWHRGNATLLDLSKDEIAYYFKVLDQEYASYLKDKNRVESKTLADRLKELKKAFDNGLISETEYEENRKTIISNF